MDGKDIVDLLLDDIYVMEEPNSVSDDASGSDVEGSPDIMADLAIDPSILERPPNKYDFVGY